MPTPAYTICPSVRRRELITASNSLAVHSRVSVIEQAPSTPCGVQHLVQSKQSEIVIPRLGFAHVAVQVLLHAGFRVAIGLAGVVIHMLEEWFVHAAAFVRRRAERHFHYGIDREERDLGLVGSAPDL